LQETFHITAKEREMIHILAVLPSSSIRKTKELKALYYMTKKGILLS
jgi:hypothetical protein